MVSERAQGCDGGGFLTPSQSAGGYEHPGILAPIRSRLPLLTGMVPECFPLGREVPVTSRNAKEKTVIFGKNTGIDKRDIWRLARGVHLGKHLLRKSFLYPTHMLVSINFFFLKKKKSTAICFREMLLQAEG